jgi:antibiotic biosynthesis monooxygenase (ABM) superfamily enzyme
MLLVVFLSTLFNLGTNIQSLKLRDIVLMIIVLVIVIVLYFLLPLAIPTIFSIIPGQEMRDQLVKSIASVAGIGTGIA